MCELMAANAGHIKLHKPARQEEKPMTHDEFLELKQRLG